MGKYVPLRKAVDATGMHPNTLRRYADEGQIKVIKNGAGQRLFDIESYINQNGKSAVVCYARVSSRHQANDLPRQREYLLSAYPNAEVISDIGSGLNFKRKGLRTLLERALRGDQLTVVVAHKDRLARFGFDLIEWIIEFNGGKVVVLDHIEWSPQQELVQDILAILTVFSARVNGLRRYRDEIKESEIVADEGARTPS